MEEKFLLYLKSNKDRLPKHQLICIFMEENCLCDMDERVMFEEMYDAYKKNPESLELLSSSHQEKGGFQR